MSLTEILKIVIEIDGVVPAIITGIITFLITKYTYHKNIPLDKLENAYNRVYYPIYCLIKENDGIDEVVEKCEVYFNKYAKYADVSTLKAFKYLKDSLGSENKNKAYSNFKNNIYAFDVKLRRRLGYLESNIFITYKYCSPSDKKLMRVFIEIMGTYLPVLIMGYVRNEMLVAILTGIFAVSFIVLIVEVLFVIAKYVLKVIKKVLLALKNCVFKICFSIKGAIRTKG